MTGCEGCERRAARTDDAYSRAHRRTSARSQEHDRDADDLQRGRSQGGDGTARQIQERVREGAWRQARLHEHLRSRSGDRKSVGEGKRVAVREKLGGSRMLKKQKKKNNNT